MSVALVAGPVVLLLIGPHLAGCLFDRRAPARTVATFHLLTLAGLAALPLVLLACAAIVRPGFWPAYLLAAGYLLRVVIAAIRAARATRGLATGTARPLGGTLVHVTAVAHPAAYALPGKVVVSQGLLALLDAPERDAVLAHELAHLRLRHHRLLFFAQVVAATLGPLARRARAALGRELEVIADQAAVTATADPRALARALAKTVLAGQPATPAPAFTGDERDLVYRLDRLTSTPRDDRHLLATAALTLLAAELLIIVGATLERAGIAVCLATAAIAWLHRRAVRVTLSRSAH